MTLTDTLKSHQTLTALDLSLNEIGDAGIQAISDLVAINNRLIHIYLSKNKITGWHGDPSVELNRYISRYDD